MAQVVIVQCDAADDPIAAEAIRVLGALARHGVVKPFWQVDSSTVGADMRAIEWSTVDTDVDLFGALSGLRVISGVRVVTIGSAALAPQAVGPLASAADRLTQLVTDVMPAGVPFGEVRIIAPTDLHSPTDLSLLLSSLATANIVVSPEDRLSDGGFALPMANADPGTFAAHVAVETATQVGMWTNMDSAPVDGALPGVIGGDVRVWIARSYVRIAVAPPLPVERAVAVSDVLPAPPGVEPAPVPHHTAAQYAAQLFQKFEALHFNEPDEFVSRSKQLPIGAAARFLRSEATAYVRNLPYQLRHGASADVVYVTGEAMTSALGDSSVVDVVWEGRIDDDPSEPVSPVSDDDLRARLFERLGRPEAPSFDQNIWSSLVDDVLAVADGGVTSEGTVPPSIGSGRVAVVTPAAIAPRPGTTVSEVLELINAEPVDAAEPTVVGQISARIRHQLQQTDQYLDSLLSTVKTSIDSLTSRDVRLLTALAWVSGVLLAATISAALIFTRTAEWLGVDSWSYTTRVRLALLGSALVVVALATLLAAGLRGTTALQNALIAFGSVLGVGVVLLLSLWSRRTDLGSLGSVRWGEIVLAITLATEIVIVIGFCRQQKTHRGATAARLTGIIAVVFAGALIVVAVVRPVGWYSEASSGSFRSLSIRLITVLVALLLVTLLVTLTLRIRERLSVDTLRLRLRWASLAAEAAAEERGRLRQALRQWHGTAAAVSRIVWSPFGSVVERERERVAEIGVGAEIRKLQFYLHEPRDEDLFGVMSRIRQEVAAPGWLLRQYRVAVESFQPDYAFKTGRAVEPGQFRRPETDPVPEDPGLAATVPGVGSRWIFDEMLFDGSFDHALRAVGSAVALDAVMESYFTRTTAALGDDANLQGFSEPLVSGEKGSLPAYLFSKIGLPVAGDPKAKYRTTVWWPTTIRRPKKLDECTVIGTTVSAAALAGLVVPFVRSDWSEPMALGQLPFAVAAPERPTSRPDPEDNRAESAELM